MKNMKILVVLLCAFLSLSSVSCNANNGGKPPLKGPVRYDDWVTVSLPGVCTFQYPPTMELENEAHREFKETIAKEILKITSDLSRVVVHQKGLNDYEGKAFDRYARVLVNTEQGNDGDFPRLEDELVFSQVELAELKVMFEQEFEQYNQQMELLEMYPCEVVNINGIDALKVSYLRVASYNKPVLVSLYIFYDYDRSYTITISYRVSEADIWKSDLDKVIYTVEFAE